MKFKKLKNKLSIYIELQYRRKYFLPVRLYGSKLITLELSCVDFKLNNVHDKNLNFEITSFYLANFELMIQHYSIVLKHFSEELIFLGKY